MLEKLRSGAALTTKEQIRLILQLSMPAILAQLSSVIMSYIDVAMIGRLGADGAASIGLVSSSTWLCGGLCSAAGTGFTVQVAHQIGAGNEQGARSIVRHGLLTALAFSVVLAFAGIWISPFLPVWLGGGAQICSDASAYFRIFACFLPVIQLRFTAGGMLQCSGNMKLPGIVNTVACVLDVLFNALLIFPSGTIRLGGLPLPGAGLGVPGAALGTALAELVSALLLAYALLFRSEMLRLRRQESAPAGSWSRECKKAAHIALPLALESLITGGAQVTSTRIVAPLGTVSIASNSFAVDVESLCYMPGYGISAAATTVIGQSMGAKRKDLTRRLGWIALALGMGIMGGCGILLYVLCPQIFRILTPAVQVQNLGTSVLRAELFAEPFFAASIVGAGIFRGAGETRTSTIINLVSMWLVRLPLAAILSMRIGLMGVWLAMAIELSVRGILFLTWFARSRTFAALP